jgi:uncharacterized protein YybS (DUF2232 family)
MIDGFETIVFYMGMSVVAGAALLVMLGIALVAIFRLLRILSDAFRDDRRGGE